MIIRVDEYKTRETIYGAIKIWKEWIQILQIHKFSYKHT